MFNFLWKLISPFTQKALTQYEIINHNNLNVDIAGWTPTDISALSSFKIRKLAILKNFNFSKWNYDNVDEDLFDIEKFEEKLFLFGKVVVFKTHTKDEKAPFQFASYDVDKKDINGEPKKIIINRENGSKLKLTVNKDCVLVYCDSSFLFGKNFLGPAWRIFQPLNELDRINSEIVLNVALSNNKITLPVDSSNEVVMALEQEVLKISPVLRLSTKHGGLNRNSKGQVDSILLRTEDRIASLLTAYRWKWNEILEHNGIKGNSEIKKERMLTNESELDNTIPEMINQAELKFRQKGIKKINEIFGVNFVLSLNKPEEKIEKVDQPEGDKKDAN